MPEDALEIIHFNGSVGATPEDLPQHLPRVFHSIFIHNIHASQILYISFDAGGIFKQIAATKDLKVEGYENKKIKSENIKYYGSGTATTFELLIIP